MEEGEHPAKTWGEGSSSEEDIGQRWWMRGQPVGCATEMGKRGSLPATGALTGDWVPLTGVVGLSHPQLGYWPGCRQIPSLAQSILCSLPSKLRGKRGDFDSHALQKACPVQLHVSRKCGASLRKSPCTISSVRWRHPAHICSPPPSFIYRSIIQGCHR